MKYLLSLFLFVGCTKMYKVNHEELTFIFPHIHYDYNWDVATSGSLWKYFITDNLVEPLLRLDEKSKYSPAIASSWQFSSDQKSIKIQIDSGHHFHDGTEIKPIDVFNSLERVLKLKKTSHSDISDAICDEEDCSGLSLKDNVITLRLNHVVNGLLFNLASPEYGITPKGYGEGDEKFKKGLMNLSGPYKVTKFDKDELKVEKVKNHYLISDRSVEKVKIKEITDFENSLDYFEKNQNTVLIGSDYSSAMKLKKIKGTKYISAPSLTEFFLPNIDSKKLNTIEKRKKIFSLIKSAVKKIDIDNDLGEKTSQVFTLDNLARVSQESVDKLYDTQVELKEEYKVLVFDWMKDTPVVPMLVEELAKVGIKLNVEIADVSSLGSILKEKDYDLIYLYSGVSAYDPIVELVYLFNHPLTQFNYKNEAGVELLKNVKQINDRETYKEMLQELHLKLLNEYRVLPVLHTRMIYVTKSKYILDELSHFDGGLSLWEWKLEK